MHFLGELHALMDATMMKIYSYLNDVFKNVPSNHLHINLIECHGNKRVTLRYNENIFL